MNRGRILLVDDYVEAAQQAQKLIHLLGYGAAHATCMLVALNLLQQEQFDCVLVDLLLEGNKADQLLAWMRDNKRSEPVFIMSEDADHALVANMLNRGAAGVISKPIELKELEKALKTMIDVQRVIA